jgi:LysM repeat protein
LIPQGSNLEQQNRTRSSLKVKILCAFGVNIAVLLVLLMQGCKREQPQPAEEQMPIYTDTNPPPFEPMIDTNPPPLSLAETNPVAPGNVPQSFDNQSVSPPPAVSPQQYVIKSGDTYSSLAPKFGVTAKAIQAANPTVDPAKLQIGKTIVIPAPSAPVTSPSATGGTVVDAVSGQTIHTVKSGDTLGKLATEFHTTVKAIQAANGLTDTRIKVGQKLKIPSQPAPGQ